MTPAGVGTPAGVFFSPHAHSRALPRVWKAVTILCRPKRDAADPACPHRAKAQQALGGVAAGTIRSARLAGILAGC
jgi:hypothetical protein